MALMLPPLNRRLAIDLIAAAHIAGTSAEVQPLVSLLLEVSALLCALPWVVDMELDPIVVSPVAAVVARARVNIEPVAHPARGRIPAHGDTSVPGGAGDELEPALGRSAQASADPRPRTPTWSAHSSPACRSTAATVASCSICRR